MVGRIISASLLAIILASSSAFGANCGADTDEVNANCYPTLQAAADAALAGDRPLVLPRGTYRIAAPVVIDCSRHAGTGFELISHGATIDATSMSGPALVIECAADCFYFHQEGTLFVNADTDGPAVVVGKADLTDAQNSGKLDHLIVNNRNSGPNSTGCQFNYVLNWDITAICDSAGGGAGIALRQVQFSVLRGAASATNGAAVAIKDGYSFADTLASLDLEASQTCWLITSTKASYFGNIAPYTNCPTIVATTHEAWNLWVHTSGGISGMAGGDVSNTLKWLD